MIRYVGLDVHKRVIQAVMLDVKGKVVGQSRFPCSRPLVEQFGQNVLTPGDQVVLEATTNCWEVVRILKPHVGQVVVSNPMLTKAIAYAKVKTDKVDARTLAELLRCDYLPTVWQPDDQTRSLRSLTRRRTSLVHQRTMMKNRIHAVLHQRLIEIPFADLFSGAGLAWLEGIHIEEADRQAIASELRLVDGIDEEIGQLDQLLACRAYDDPRVKLLMTLPGVDVSVGQAVIAALADVHRFKSGDHAASYLGIVPSTRKSADHCYHGSITKQGNSQARSMLIQAAQVVARHPGPLGVFFRRLAKKKNWNVAVTATARKLVVIAWHMLKNNEPYRYALPRTVKQKLGQLRVKATGQRRKPQPGKRDESSCPGVRKEKVPSLTEVLLSEGLPAPKELSDGERRIVTKLELMDLIGCINTPRTILRKKKSAPSADAAAASTPPSGGEQSPCSAGPSTAS